MSATSDGVRSTAAGGGQRVDDLSLAELHSYDLHPQQSGNRTRFLCPRHGGDRQKSLTVDDDTGKFRCHNGTCGIWGTVTEKKERRGTLDGWGSSPGRRSTWDKHPERPLADASPFEPNAYAVRRAVAAFKQFAGSPAEEYARRRGIPDDLAARLHLGYWRGTWQGEESEWLTFPLRCPVTGKPVAIYGRNLHSDDQARKGRVLGPKGLFGASKPGPMPADVIVCEGVFEALALLSNPELPPARAVCGASARAEWFDTCARVIIVFDDDDAGRAATERLVEDLNARRLRRQQGPKVLSLRASSLREQHDCKDLGELLARGIVVTLDLPPLLTAVATEERAPSPDPGNDYHFPTDDDAPAEATGCDSGALSAAERANTLPDLESADVADVAPPVETREADPGADLRATWPRLRAGDVVGGLEVTAELVARWKAIPMRCPKCGGDDWDTLPGQTARTCMTCLPNAYGRLPLSTLIDALNGCGARVSIGDDGEPHLVNAEGVWPRLAEEIRRRHWQAVRVARWDIPDSPEHAA